MSLPTRLGYTRALAARWLTATCTIHQPGEIIPLPGGGTGIGPGTDHPNVPCRLTTSGTRASIAAFGEQLASTADWTLLVATDVLVEDGWTVTANGATFPVISAVTPTGAAYRAALLRGQTPVPESAEA